MVATYLGLTWWDNESDGAKMYPATQHNPSQDEEQESLIAILKAPACAACGPTSIS